ncbi:hypothetical protein [Rhizobium tumorigenes]|uniref:Uncharacterized protein n=1 Tax=Rhizobium tumorigenes TaxID=2041385 RepID=A0AAF1K9D9_9HYPH|nr:hypothetical protein [Rhizobium tumorigenes]WFR98707.1 hypothetical protein PR017_23695 [Rhizobium tumorigenes]
MALILVSVLNPLERAKTKPAAAWKCPRLFLVIPPGADLAVDLLAALDGIVEHWQFAPAEQRVERRAVHRCLDRVLAQDAVSLAATAGAAEERLTERAINERLLRPGLRRPG